MASWFVPGTRGNRVPGIVPNSLARGIHQRPWAYVFTFQRRTKSILDPQLLTFSRNPPTEERRIGGLFLLLLLLLLRWYDLLCPGCDRYFATG